jgi:hypothetical protein
MTGDDVPEEVFSGAPTRLTMGLRPLDMTTWLDADPDDPQIGLRRELLASRRLEVFGALPGSESARAEVAGAVADQVGASLPRADDPLVEAAALVRDDLCVLEQREGQWLLTAGVVCFPSRWRLAEKLGRDVTAIHDPVPRYRKTLGTATDSAMAAIARMRPRWRVNWTLLDDPELFQPSAPTGRSHRPGMHSFLRVERQCLVPVGEAIVFTIRTTVLPVAELDRTKAEAVLASVAASPDDLAHYRGWDVS